MPLHHYNSEYNNQSPELTVNQEIICTLAFLLVFKKIGCAAANPWLMHGKHLYYGTMGLVNGNINLRNIRLMLYWQERNIIVALRRKRDAIALLPKAKRFS